MKSSFFIPVTVIAFTAVTAAAFALRAQDAAASTSRGGSKPSADLKAAEKSAPDKQVSSLLSDGFKEKLRREYPITVGTEMTDAGRKLPMPTFDKPVYYIVQSVERHDIGDVRGDTKDTPDIPVAALKQLLFTALAANGYCLADANHPPTQAITCVCGVLNKIDPVNPNSEVDPDAQDKAAQTFLSVPKSPSPPGTDKNARAALSPSDEVGMKDSSRLQNLRSHAEIVGGKKFADEFAAAFSGQLQCSGTVGCEPSDSLRRFVTRDDTTGVLVYAIFNDCYYCIVTSHDMGALKNNGGKLLWTTRVSAISQKFSFEQRLPVMVITASWYFGRETDGVEVLRRGSYMNTKGLIIGEHEVEYISGTASASGTSATTAPKPASSGAASATGKP